MRWLPVGLLAAGLMRAMAGAALAQTPSPPPAAVDAPRRFETTVTALRLPRPLPDVPATVTVLPREELERVPGLGMDEMVRLSPTAATFRRSPSLLADPTAQGLSLRAVGPSGVSRALVLVDGIPANEPFGGWVFWRALPRLGLDRVEIVPGGSSALYGNYGLGGVVELVSRPIDNALELDASGGSLETGAAAARVAGRRGPVAGALEVDSLRSAGYVPVAPEQRGAIDLAGASHHVGLRGRGELQATPSILLHARGGFFLEDQNGGTRLTTAAVKSGSWALGARRASRGGDLDLGLFGSIDRFEQQRARIAPGRSSETLAARQRVPSDGLGARLVYTSPPLSLGGQHQLMVGTDLRRVVGHSREAINPAAPMPAAVVGREAGGQQRFAGLFAADVYSPVDPVELSAAVRGDVWQNVGGRGQVTRMDGSGLDDRFDDRALAALSTRLGLLLRPSGASRVRASAYRAFRAPTLNELYRPFQVGTVLTDANPRLDAERLWGAELGFERLLGEAGSVRATGFWSWLDQPIANVTLATPSPGGATRQRQNLGRVSSQGVELSADMHLPAYLNLAAAYTFARAQVRAAAALPDLVGKDVPHAPRHRGRLALGVVWPRRLEGTVQLRLEGRSFEDDVNQLPMAGYAVIDLHLGLPLGAHFTIFGSVQNLLDHRYLVGRAGVDTIGPPLLALGGVRVR
jgi:iron complex outermembrane recepter protein